VPKLNKTIGFLGAGNMAEAFVGALVRSDLCDPAGISVSDILEERLQNMEQTYGVAATTDNVALYAQSDVVIMAVKPQQTTELLLQIFYPNTPLHDGAVVIVDGLLVAASCVMPLSASGVLARSPERQMGLRHRAALGISEVSDAVAVIVSEETGAISVVHGGRMIRRLDVERLENILRTFFRPQEVRKGLFGLLDRITIGRDQPGGGSD